MNWRTVTMLVGIVLSALLAGCKLNNNIDIGWFGVSVPFDISTFIVIVSLGPLELIGGLFEIIGEIIVGIFD